MSRQPAPDDPRETIRALRRALRDARACMTNVAGRLDFTNVGKSKWQLYRCADRVAADLKDNNR